MEEVEGSMKVIEGRRLRKLRPDSEDVQQIEYGGRRRRQDSEGCEKW